MLTSLNKKEKDMSFGNSPFATQNINRFHRNSRAGWFHADLMAVLEWGTGVNAFVAIIMLAIIEGGFSIKAHHVPFWITMLPFTAVYCGFVYLIFIARVNPSILGGERRQFSYRPWLLRLGKRLSTFLLLIVGVTAITYSPSAVLIWGVNQIFTISIDTDWAYVVSVSAIIATTRWNWQTVKQFWRKRDNAKLLQQRGTS